MQDRCIPIDSLKSYAEVCDWNIYVVLGWILPTRRSVLRARRREDDSRALCRRVAINSDKQLEGAKARHMFSKSSPDGAATVAAAPGQSELDEKCPSLSRERAHTPPRFAYIAERITHGILPRLDTFSYYLFIVSRQYK